MLQHRPNWMELRSMDSHIQILCRFQKCKRKVPPPSLLSNEKSPFSTNFLHQLFCLLIFLSFEKSKKKTNFILVQEGFFLNFENQKRILGNILLIL
jgi:hypothetical protein